jgi:hypothetical protein
MSFFVDPCTVSDPVTLSFHSTPSTSTCIWGQPTPLTIRP